MNETNRYLKSLPATDRVEVGKLVDLLVQDAIAANASDIHIEPWESTLVVRLRLNGVLQELVHLPLELMDKISSRLKVMANLVNYEFDRPQEGHAKASGNSSGVELRLSFFPVVRGNREEGLAKGEKIVVRLFDPANRSFNLDELGLEEETLRAFKTLLLKPNGMILLTGPTGSGKTTAIYAALSYLVRKYGSTVSISTVEDPVEFNLPMISQSQVNPLREFTYPIALRSLMRQDPQVIMVGEIRDPETAAIAVQAGLTGHLVISTIHSGSTTGVFARLINMSIEPFLLASSIAGVIGLRLIRKNCTLCAEPYQPDASVLRIVPHEALEHATWRRGGGCAGCHMTGYNGRTSITETLVVDEVTRDAIMQKLPTRRLHEIAIQQGMVPLAQMGMRRALAGETPLEELARVLSVD